MTEELKEVMFNIKRHFKRTDIKPWPLNYIIYFEMSKAAIIPFNKTLIKSGFKIIYNKKLKFVTIVKRNKK